MSLCGLVFICCLALRFFEHGVMQANGNFTRDITLLAEYLMPKGTTEIIVHQLTPDDQNKQYSDKFEVFARTLGTLAPVSLGDFPIRQFGFIITNSPLQLKRWLGHITLAVNRVSLLVYFTTEVSLSEHEDIFDVCLDMHITNIYAVSEHSAALWLVTYFPFTQKQCFSNQPQLMCVSHDAGFRSLDGGQCVLGARKFANFHGCQLQANALLSPPYFYHQESGASKGVEVDILDTLAEELNFTILLNNDSRTPEGFQPAQSTPEEADIFIGRLQTTSIQQRNISSSFSYGNSKLVVIIHSGRSLFSLERILIPASRDVWLSLLAVVTLVYLLLQAIDHGSQSVRDLILDRADQHPAYWAWVVIFGGSVNLRPQGLLARSLLFHWILLNFFLRCGYQSLVYTSIRLDWKVGTPRTITEAVESGYTLTASPETHDSLKEIDHMAPLIKPYETSDLEALHQLELESEAKVAVIMPKEVFRFHLGAVKQSELRIIGKPLLQQMISMRFKDQSFLKDPFDALLGRMESAGLLDHWFEIHLKRAVRREQVARLPRAIIFADVEGHFQILGVLLTVCFLFFLLEILSLRVHFLERLL